MSGGDNSMENIKLLWKDRKRHLGMPLSFTRYSMSDDRIFLESDAHPHSCYIHENAPSRIAKRSERSVMVRAWWSASSLCSKR